MNENYYQDREQTLAKHRILEGYLERLAVKVGMRNGNVAFVDGFSGPWDERSDAFEDTSFAVALRCLDKARQAVVDAGRPANFSCFFNERSRSAYEKLSRHLRHAREEYPNLKIRDYHGRWEDNATLILDDIPSSAFRLVFIDPCGWTGFPPSSLRPICTGHSEVLINFMHEHIRRFIGGRHERWREWMLELLGDRVRYEDAIPNDFDIEWVKSEYHRMLRKEIGKKYVAQADIFATDADRVHFSLVFGTSSPVGVDEFRKAERLSLSDHDRNRQASDFVEGTMSLFGGEVAAGPYERKVEQIIHELPDLFLRTARSYEGPCAFRDLKVSLQERFPLLEKEIKDAFVELAKSGKVEPSWKRRSTRAYRPTDDDVVVCL